MNSRRTELVPYVAPGSEELAYAPEYLTFNNVLIRLWKGRTIVLATLFAGVALAAGLILTQEKVYQSRTAIEIRIPNEDYLNRRQLNPVTELNALMLEPYLQTQLRLIQSDTLLLQVARKLNLAETKEYDPAPSLMTRVKNGFRPIEHKPISDLALLDKVRSRLTLRLAGSTQILDIMYDSTDPKLAAAFANTLAAEYQALSLELTAGATTQTAGVLATEIATLKSTLDRSESELRNFLNANRLLPSNNQESVAEIRLKQLQASLSIAQDARVAAQSKYEQVRSTTADPLASDLDSDALRAYRLKLTELREKLAESGQVLTSGHYKLRQIQAEIEEVQKAFDRERTGTLARLYNDYKASEFREKVLARDYEQQASQVAAQTGQAMRFTELRHEAEVNRQLYDAMLQKSKEANAAAAMKFSNVRIVDPAVPAEDPIKPNKPLFAAIGLAAGFLLGVVIVLGRNPLPVEAVASTVRNLPAPGETHSRETIGTSSGSTELIPAVSNPAAFDLGPTAAIRVTQPGPMILRKNADDPTILTVGRGGEGQVLCVSGRATETRGSELASVLARELAFAGHKVLLIDADSVKPTLHQIFNVPEAPGFFDLISVHWEMAQIRKNSAIWMVGDLCVMPAGAYFEGIPEIAKRARIPALFDSLRRDFDLVLIKMPPMRPRSNSQCLWALADGCVVSGDQSAEKVRDASESLRQQGVKAVHVVSLEQESIRKSVVA